MSLWRLVLWVIWPPNEPLWAKILVPILAAATLLALITGLYWVAILCVFLALAADRVRAS